MAGRFVDVRAQRQDGQTRHDSHVDPAIVITINQQNVFVESLPCRVQKLLEENFVMKFLQFDPTFDFHQADDVGIHFRDHPRGVLDRGVRVIATNQFNPPGKILRSFYTVAGDVAAHFV